MSEAAPQADGEGPLVRYQRRGRVGIITLNRPGKLNAVSDAMSAALAAALYAFDEDDEAWVGILHGSGRAFCSGADVQQRQMQSDDALRRSGGPGARDHSLFGPIYRSTNSKPLIAAVHGFALGIGLYLALVCDIIVAGRGTRFQIAEVRRGLNGGRFRALVADRCSNAFADEVAITGRMWQAEEAHAKGMLQYLADADAAQVLDVAHSVAAEVLNSAPLPVRAIVRERRARLEQIEARSHATRAQGLHLSDDFKESVRAFAEKRPPVFRGS